MTSCLALCWNHLLGLSQKEAMCQEAHSGEQWWHDAMHLKTQLPRRNYIWVLEIRSEKKNQKAWLDL